MAASYDVISSDRVEGTTVYNTAGEKLGTIDDLMIDKVSGQVRYAVMEFGGFLGMGTDRYPVQPDAAQPEHHHVGAGLHLGGEEPPDGEPRPRNAAPTAEQQNRAWDVRAPRRHNGECALGSSSRR